MEIVNKNWSVPRDTICYFEDLEERNKVKKRDKMYRVLFK